MDIYYNGKIYGSGADHHMLTAMAVKDGLIFALGNDEEMLALADGSGETVDLGGRLVMPGFIDSHMHFLEYALEKSFIDLSGAGSLDDMLSMLKQSISGAHGPETPLIGTGFNQNFWEDPAMPERSDIDRVSMEIPIILQRTCHHIAICNTPALKLCGMLDDRPDGILREDDLTFLERFMRPASLEHIKDLIIKASEDALSKGITEVQSDDLRLDPLGVYGETVIRAFTELDKEGHLPIRVYEQCNLPSMDRLRAFLDDGYVTGVSTGNFTIGPLKLIADGTLGAATAALIDPYREDLSNRGILDFTDEELFELVDTAHRAGMQIAIHGIGDRCIDQILNVYEMVLRSSPRPDHRHGIVHCQITHPEQLRRIKDLGVTVYIQPVFIRADRYIVEKRVGEELASTSYDWRKMLDMGIRLSGGSDCPIEAFDVLPNMYYAVERKAPGDAEGWDPEKSLTLEEAIRLFTEGGAFASFSEDRLGRLLPGFAADFSVIDRDVTAMPSDALNEAQVLLTVVGGKVRYRSASILRALR